MFAPTEFTHGDKGIDLLQSPRQVACVSPALRWSPIVHHATQALSAGAGLLLMAPQNVTGTDEPMFMGHIQFESVSQVEQARPSNQRDVVIVDNVELPLRQDVANLSPMNNRSAELVCQKQGKRSESTVQLHSLDAIGTVTLGRGIAAIQSAESVDVVQDRNAVATPNERLREPLDADTITTKIERRVERRDHAEVKSAQSRDLFESNTMFRSGTRRSILPLTLGLLEVTVTSRNTMWIHRNGARDRLTRVTRGMVSA
jgi:hypothetical protein